MNIDGDPHWTTPCQIGVKTDHRGLRNNQHLAQSFRLPPPPSQLRLNLQLPHHHRHHRHLHLALLLLLLQLPRLLLLLLQDLLSPPPPRHSLQPSVPMPT